MIFAFYCEIGTIEAKKNWLICIHWPWRAWIAFYCLHTPPVLWNNVTLSVSFLNSSLPMFFVSFFIILRREKHIHVITNHFFCFYFLDHIWLWSRITLGWFGEPYEVLATKPRSSAWASNACATYYLSDSLFYFYVCQSHCCESLVPPVEIEGVMLNEVILSWTFKCVFYRLQISEFCFLIEPSTLCL